MLELQSWFVHILLVPVRHGLQTFQFCPAGASWLHPNMYNKLGSCAPKEGVSSSQKSYAGSFTTKKASRRAFQNMMCLEEPQVL